MRMVVQEGALVPPVVRFQEEEAAVVRIKEHRQMKTKRRRLEDLCAERREKERK